MTTPISPADVYVKDVHFKISAVIADSISRVRGFRLQAGRYQGALYASGGLADMTYIAFSHSGYAIHVFEFMVDEISPLALLAEAAEDESSDD